MFMLFCHPHSCSGAQRLERATFSSTYCHIRKLRCKYYRFPPNQNSFIEGGNYYADMLAFLNRLCIAVIVTLTAHRDNEVGQLYLVSLSIAQNEPETRITSSCPILVSTFHVPFSAASHLFATNLGSEIYKSAEA